MCHPVREVAWIKPKCRQGGGVPKFREVIFVVVLYGQFRREMGSELVGRKDPFVADSDETKCIRKMCPFATLARAPRLLRFRELI